MTISQIQTNSLASGVAGTGPAFAAEDGATTATANVTTKVVFDIEIFDTDSAWDGSQFLPLVAGYYQINAVLSTSTTSAVGTMVVRIYKNGSLYSYSAGYYGSGYQARPSVSSVVYLNGSTDYVEIYGTNNGNGSFGQAYVSGCLVRAA